MLPDKINVVTFNDSDGADIYCKYYASDKSAVAGVIDWMLKHSESYSDTDADHEHFKTLCDDALNKVASGEDTSHALQKAYDHMLAMFNVRFSINKAQLNK